jgi:TolB-like protein/Flp pilus assembly protein TadD
VLIGFNVAGLRDRLLTIVGASVSRRTVPLPRIESIAVLPLANLSGDPEQEYFADGMTEELITNLGKISALRVISRTSVMRYKGTKKPLPEIARELNMDAIVEGTVQRSGNRVRISAQLIQARPERHLWAESYERDLRDVLALQSEVARAIANEIRLKLTPQEQTRLASARPVNPAAHEAYLRGRYHWNKVTDEGIRRSIREFEQAIEIDPQYAVAYAGVADAYIFLSAWSRAIPPKEVLPKAKAAAVKALEIDETLPEAHTALALARLLFELDWSAAESGLKRAIELNPSYPVAHQWYALLLSSLGRHDEAIAEAKRAHELDPLSLQSDAQVGLHYYFARQYDQAIQRLHQTLELDPNFPPAHYWLGIAYLEKGASQEALEALQTAVRLSGSSGLFEPDLARAYGLTGKRDAARRILGELQELSRKKYVPADSIAIIYIGLGDKNRALEWLEKAREESCAGSILLLKVAPWLDPLRSDPRFQDLLRRMNFPK